LIKPFDPEILLLKLNLILQNSATKTTAIQKFQIGNYVFDYSKRLLILNEKAQKLSPKEAELLKLFAEKKGEVLTHEEALMKIWKNDDFFTKQSMNVFITKLRKYFQKDQEYSIEIENLHSKGFVMTCQKKDL
jgi:DNA-binding response OmpR family regulator